MDLLSEVKSIIPTDKYIDLSKVPALYFTRFNKKFNAQPGAKKVAAFIKEFPSHFTVEGTRSLKDPKVTVYKVIQVLEAGIIVEAPAPFTQLSTTDTDPTPNAPTAKASKRKKSAKLVAAPLDSRGDMAVPPLAEVTAYLRSKNEPVPVGQLASFVFSEHTSQIVTKTSLLIKETNTVSAETGCSVLGLSVDSGVTKPVYMNTADPFCAICIGVQGAGKSHTMNVILENCILDSVQTNEASIVSTSQPMCGLVLHYDQSQTNACEAAGLTSPASRLSLYPHLHAKRLVVLVSPTYYVQRKAYYGGHCEVIPLLFDWASLTATQLKKLMGLTDSSTQLYVSTMLNKLRGYQRNDQIPTFSHFLEEVTQDCDVKGQGGPLKQRLDLLESIVRESVQNTDLREAGCKLTSLLAPGTLVVADLTDPLMSVDEVCGVFQVLLEQFRCHPLGDVGKVVAFDEAHKYLDKSTPGCIELSNAIVDTVRLMRHEGIRVLVSTQSPLTLPPELLELASVTILHKFQSADWAKYLASKVPLPHGGFQEIQGLQQGHALLLSTQIDVSERQGEDSGDDRDQGGRALVVSHLKLHVRPRLTLDLGASRRNNDGNNGNGSASGDALVQGVATMTL